jgi:hypothetical protein
MLLIIREQFKLLVNKKIEIKLYNPKNIIKMISTETVGKTILIVGHSNTTQILSIK